MYEVVGIWYDGMVVYIYVKFSNEEKIHTHCVCAVQIIIQVLYSISIMDTSLLS